MAWPMSLEDFSKNILEPTIEAFVESRKMPKSFSDAFESAVEKLGWHFGQKYSNEYGVWVMQLSSKDETIHKCLDIRWNENDSKMSMDEFTETYINPAIAHYSRSLAQEN